MSPTFHWSFFVVLWVSPKAACCQPEVASFPQPVQVIFTNYTLNSLDVFQVESDGNERLKFTLFPGDSHPANTKVRAAWIFKLKWQNKKVATFRANESPKQRFEILNDFSNLIPISKGQQGYVDLSLENPFRAPLDYYWTNFEGNRIWIGTISGGKKIKRQTGKGHCWVARDKQGKQLIPFVTQTRGNNICRFERYRSLPLQKATIWNKANRPVSWKCLIPGREIGVSGKIGLRKTAVTRINMIAPGKPGKIVVSDGKKFLGVFTPEFRRNDGWTVTIP